MPNFTKSVVANGDDGWARNDGSFSSTGTTMFAGQDDPGGGSQECRAFARFTGVTIPQYSIVTAASITFYNTSYGGPAGTISLTWGFVAADNQAAPTDKAGVWALSYSTGSSGGTDPGTGTVTLTGLATSAQNVFGRAGWANGNALVFLLKDNGGSGDRKWVLGTYDGSYAASISIDYIIPGGGEPVSVTPYMMV